jgi:hypothetical protein
VSVMMAMDGMGFLQEMSGDLMITR